MLLLGDDVLVLVGLVLDDRDLDEVLGRFEKVSLADVQQLANWLAKKQRSVVAVGEVSAKTESGLARLSL